MLAFEPICPDLYPGEGRLVGVCGGMPSRLPVDAASLLLLDAIESRSLSFAFLTAALGLRCLLFLGLVTGFVKNDISSGCRTPVFGRIKHQSWCHYFRARFSLSYFTTCIDLIHY